MSTSPQWSRDQGTNGGHAERDRGKEGQNEKMWVREKVRGSINHSYAPVRVASGTKRNHMQADNILRPPASGTGSQQTSSSSSPGRAITPCTLTLDPEEIGHPAYALQTLHLPSSLLLQTAFYYSYNYFNTSHLQIVCVWGWKSPQMSMWPSVCLCVIGILDRIDVCAYTLIKAVPLSTL